MYVACIIFLVDSVGLYNIYSYVRVPGNDIDGMMEKKYLKIKLVKFSYN